MRNAMLTSLMLSLACHMGDVFVTTGGQDVGEEGPPPDESTTTSSGTDGTTGLGHSESGPPTDGSTSGSGTSSGSDSGSSADDTGSTTGCTDPDACCLPFEQPDGSYACFCSGEWSDPAECGCSDEQGGCECPGFQPSDLPCLVPILCEYDPALSACICDGELADPSMCDCMPVAGIPTECACDGWPAPTEFCQE